MDDDRPAGDEPDAEHPDRGSGWAPLDPQGQVPPPGDRDGPGPAPSSSAGPPPSPPPPPPPPPGWVAAGGGSGPWGAPWGQAAGGGNVAVGGTERTGPLPMRPMNVGDILDGAFKLFKANARTVMTVVAAITLPLQLLSAWALRNSFTPFSPIDPAASAGPDLTGIGASLLGGLLSLLVTPFIAGAIARVVASSYLGHQVGPGDALRFALRRFGALLGAFVLVHLAELSGIIACFVGFFVTGPLFMALYVLTAPAIVVEELGPIEGMRRSWRLVRPRFWPVLGTALLAGLIASVISNILTTLPVGVVLVAEPSWGWVVVAAAGVVASLVTEPIVAIVATLLYFDARIRHEGFDLELMAADLGRRPAGIR